MIELFEQRIGTPYPYARYSQIAVTDFIFGGMENTSATTQTDRTLHDETRTSRLLERSTGLARARASMVRRSADLPRLVARVAERRLCDLLRSRLARSRARLRRVSLRRLRLRRAHICDEDADRYRRPIVCNRYRDPIEIFDRHLYQKGAAVLHMLRGELGDARFWRSIARYVEHNAQRNVETIDLIRAIEEATGRNHARFLRSVGLRERVIPNSKYASPGTQSATSRPSRSIRSRASTPSIRPSGSTSTSASARRPTKRPPRTRARPLPGERRVRARVERAHETITVPLDSSRSSCASIRARSSLASVTYRARARRCRGRRCAATRTSSRAIRAARELAKDGSRQRARGADAAFDRDPFWGVLGPSGGRARRDARAVGARDALERAARTRIPRCGVPSPPRSATFATEAPPTRCSRAAQQDASYFVRAPQLGARSERRAIRARSTC